MYPSSHEWVSYLSWNSKFPKRNKLKWDFIGSDIFFRAIILTITFYHIFMHGNAEILLPSLWPKLCLEFFRTNFYFRTVHFQYECTCSYWIGKINRKYSHWKPAVYSLDIVFVSTCCQIVNAIDLWAHVAPKKKAKIHITCDRIVSDFGITAGWKFLVSM